MPRVMAGGHRQQSTRRVLKEMTTGNGDSKGNSDCDGNGNVDSIDNDANVDTVFFWIGSHGSWCCMYFDRKIFSPENESVRPPKIRIPTYFNSVPV
jgi:hypothetical protein